MLLSSLETFMLCLPINQSQTWITLEIRKIVETFINTVPWEYASPCHFSLFTASLLCYNISMYCKGKKLALEAWNSCPVVAQAFVYM